MYILTVIFLTVCVLVLLAARHPVTVKARFDTDTAVPELFFYFLDPFLKARAEIRGPTKTVSVFLFNRHILTKTMLPKKSAGAGGKRRTISRADAARALALGDVSVCVRCSLDNPFATGVASGAACMLGSVFGSLLENASFTVTPDFLSPAQYAALGVTAKLYIGKTALNYFKLVLAEKKSRRRDEYGSAEFI